MNEPSNKPISLMQRSQSAGWCRTLLKSLVVSTLACAALSASAQVLVTNNPGVKIGYPIMTFPAGVTTSFSYTNTMLQSQYICTNSLGTNALGGGDTYSVWVQGMPANTTYDLWTQQTNHFGSIITGLTNSKSLDGTTFWVSNTATPGLYPCFFMVATNNGDPSKALAVPFYLNVARVWGLGGTNATGDYRVNGDFNLATSWMGGVVPTNTDDVVFTQWGAQTNSTPVPYTNVSVYADKAVGSMRFTPTNGTLDAFTIDIAPGKTLSLVGSNGLTLLRDSMNSFVGNANQVYVHFTGTNGTLVVNNPNASVSTLVDNATGSKYNFLVMTNLGMFYADVDHVAFGDYARYPFFFTYRQWGSIYSRTAISKMLTTVYLARTNVIRATYVDPFHFNNPFSRDYSFSFGSTENQGTTQVPALYLGQTNMFYLDSFCLPHANSSATMMFGPWFGIVTNGDGLRTTNIQYAVFRGTNGGRMSNFTISDDGGSTNDNQSNVKGTVDFSSNFGYLDLLVDQMYMARDPYLITSNQTPNAQANLFFGRGFINANDLYMAYQQSNGRTNWGVNYQGYCTANFVVSNTAVLSVNHNLTMGYTADTTSFATPANNHGVLNIQGGAQALINRIVVDGGANVSLGNNITNNNSYLAVTNGIGGPTKWLDNLSLINGATLALGLNGANLNPVAYITNFSTVAPLNNLAICAIQNPSDTVHTYPLITWQSGGTPILRLPSLAAFGYPNCDLRVGTVADGTSPSGVDNILYLDILTNAPRQLVWKGNVNSYWDTTNANWVIQGTGTSVTYTNGDDVIFDDTASLTNVVAVMPYLYPHSVTFNNVSKGFLLSAANSGQIPTTVNLDKYGAGTLTFAVPSLLAVNVHEGLLIGDTNTASFGSVSVDNGATAKVVANVAGGLTCAGSMSILAPGSGLGNNVSVGGTVVVNAGGCLTNTFSATITAPSITINSNGVVDNRGTINSTVYGATATLTVNSNGLYINDTNGALAVDVITVSGTFMDFGQDATQALPTDQSKLDVNTILLASKMTVNPGGRFIPAFRSDIWPVRTFFGVPGSTSITGTNTGWLQMLAGSTNVFRSDLNGTSGQGFTYTKVYVSKLDLGASAGTPAMGGCTLLINSWDGISPIASPATNVTYNLFGNTYDAGSYPLLGGASTNNFPLVYPAPPVPGAAWDESQTIYDNRALISHPVWTNTVPNPLNYSVLFGTNYSYTNYTVTNSGVVTTNQGVSGTNNVSFVHLKWPTNYIGWRLFTCNNGSLSNGISPYMTNWTLVFDSAWNTNEFYFTNSVDVTNGSVKFYRLVYP